ncbi:MAG TPA: DUF4229 domain-containing protein [Candidatus Nanopelagicales bacterium]|nr:DUF4229 domain-containing protein [Candidatus Nanopelagicales bacterium]
MSEPTSDPSDAVVEGDLPVESAAPAQGFGRHPIVIYTVQRLALLLVVGGVLYLLHVRGIFLILFAFLISGFIAMVALRGSREGAAYGITHAVQKVNDRIDASTRAEDYDDLDDDLVEPAPSDDEPRA